MIQSEWFLARIKKRYGSLRKFVTHLESRQGKTMDVSAFSRVLSGERSLSLEEAVQVAKLLGVSVVEIAKRLGIK